MRLNKMVTLMSNQTIDGVPRAWLEEYESLADLTSGDAQRLRALLDAPAETVAGHHPACRAVDDYKAGECSHSCKPASQPQGVPVAWTEVDVLDFMSVALRHAEYSGLSPSDILDGLRYMAEKGKPAYTAALPAPVAVALSDPGPDQQVEARAKEIYEGWSYNPGFAPWVDGGNSIMQSKARDLARRELAPVAAAQTCCGSCPGGCVYGLKA
ncbi:MAG: hypothetical protein KBC45_06295 [Pseudomonas sp.]|uniref:hypothetical protein n=2 Tax=Pseudomonas sp. TaxID=306 RepID=UPI001B6987AC|nr:hypothetical protein [Pseudomonas sp.]MBP6954021.1 hypothetical protein [Pseudomonas sp.]